MNGVLADNPSMPTQRDMLKLGDGHPFYDRMLLLRDLFKRFEKTEEHRGGVFQDGEIELRFRGANGDVGDYEPESLIEYGVETYNIESIHRLCQIVLLYSTLESFCFGALGNGASMRVDDSLIQCARKRAKAGRLNLVLTLLDEAELRGMESSVWPSRQPYIKAFVELRGHLVHEGLEVTKKLITKLKPFLPAIEEFPGSTPEQKLDRLGQEGSLVQIPRSFVSTLFDLLQELVANLIVPVDSEEPDINNSIAELFNWARRKDDDDPK